MNYRGNCQSLTLFSLKEKAPREILVPNGVIEIAKNAFCGSDIVGITLPPSLKRIGTSAFEGCLKIRSIELPDGLEYLGPHTFSGSGITEIAIPKGVTKIRNGTFEGCKQLKSVQLHNEIDSIGKSAFRCCSELIEILIPPKVREIKKRAFERCLSLRTIRLPDRITAIGDSAFSCDTSIKEVLLPCVLENAKWSSFGVYQPVAAEESDHFVQRKSFEGVREETQAKFMLFISNGGCPPLKSQPRRFQRFDFEIDNKTVIGFRGAVPRAVDIPNGVAKIGGSLFKNSTIVCIRIADSVKEIGESAFQNCQSLESITLGKGIESIGKKAFKGCFLIQTILIPSRVVEIQRETFYGCASLKAVHLSENLEIISEKSFKMCGALSDLILPPKLKEIGYKAFMQCGSLKGIKLPEKVQRISFVGLPRRLDDFFEGNGAAFLNLDESGKSVVGICEGFEGRMEIPEGVERIEKGAFKNSRILDIRLPDSLKFIGDDAFMNCKGLNWIQLPSSIEYIGSGAFFGCRNLKGEIVIPKKVKRIFPYTFCGCKFMTSVIESKRVQSEPASAFKIGFHITRLFSVYRPAFECK